MIEGRAPRRLWVELPMVLEDACTREERPQARHGRTVMALLWSFSLIGA